MDFQAACKWPGIIRRLLGVILAIASTALQHILISKRSRQMLAAENLFLRKQLALFKEREVKPRRADDATRAALVWLSRSFNWRGALVVVKPATLIRWHREGFRRYWKFKSRPGRPVLPRDVRALIRQMASENPNWGEERIGIVACDYFTVVTATFRELYVFVVVEHATRRILHFNVTAHPTADWTLQQLRESIPEDHSYNFLIRDRDDKFSRRLDESIRRLRLQTLKTPNRTPQANQLAAAR
jgi:hypothetical protein